MRYAVEPCPKPRMTRRDKWAKRPCVMRYRAFKDKVRLRRVELPQPCTVVFWMPMPKSWAQSVKLAHEGQPHRCKPDLDNLVKGLWDALYANDAALWQVTAEKRWSRTGCIEVRTP